MSRIIGVTHPGSYLKDYLEEIQMTQDEFANRLGITGKQISLILAESANITPDIALKLSKFMGTSVEVWLNLQASYDAYIVQLKQEKEYEEEVRIFEYIDRKFLKELKIIDNKEKKDIAISKVRTEIQVSSLSLLKNPDMCSLFRTSINKPEDEATTVCRNVWVSLAMKLAKEKEVDSFNEKKLIEFIPLFRKMTLENPETFYPMLDKMLCECGVALVLLPTLSRSNTNGVIKWIDSNKVMMALNTRGAYNDKFWFSFFHEIKHVLQQVKRKVIISEDEINLEDSLETEADLFARETLIPFDDYKKFNKYTPFYINKFANRIGIHPGIVVGRLQKDGKIEYSQFNNLKEKYKIMV